MLDNSLQEEIKKILFKFLDPKVFKVFVFGSRATGSGSRFSDVDLGIKGNKKLESEKLLELEEAFENSNLPFGVDIVDFSRVSPKFKKVALKKVVFLN